MIKIYKKLKPRKCYSDLYQGGEYVSTTGMSFIQSQIYNHLGTHSDADNRSDPYWELWKNVSTRLISNAGQIST